MNLYELTEAYNALIEIDDIDPCDFAFALDTINGELDDKLCSIGRLVRNLEAECAGIKCEEERLAKKRKAHESKIDRLKEYVKSAMLATGRTKASDGIITWGIQKNPASVQIDGTAAIPHELCRYTPESWTPDKKLIAEKLKSGEAVDGCTLIQTEGVRLK